MGKGLGWEDYEIGGLTVLGVVCENSSKLAGRLQSLSLLQINLSISS